MGELGPYGVVFPCPILACVLLRFRLLKFCPYSVCVLISLFVCVFARFYTFVLSILVSLNGNTHETFGKKKRADGNIFIRVFKNIRSKPKRHPYSEIMLNRLRTRLTQPILRRTVLSPIYTLFFLSALTLPRVPCVITRQYRFKREDMF